ncbi:MAG: hypothetical protein DBX47_02565 [Clostridiales bacterium]|nr:MAG: hypothetical protein DBX47_02565 [Clostridiales bacterium]
MDLKYKLIIISALVIISGVVCGVLWHVPQNAGFAEYIDVVVNGRVSLFSAITSNTLFVFIIFLLGYFSFGFTLIYPLLFFKAFTAGISARLCVEIYGLYGVNYILVYILPVSLITLLLMALLSSQSFIFSYKSILGGDKNEVLKRLLHQTVFGSVFVLMSSFAVIWDAFLNPIVAKVI